MDIETMKTFLVLVDTKNFTRTAHQLFIAQSTVTNRILELEKELNVTLFERNNRSVELTPAGERFSLYAASVIRLTDTAMAEISSIHKFENTLRIGSSDSVYEAHLAPIIQAHQRNHPEDALKISIGLSSQLLEQLQSDILDVVFSYIPLRNPKFHCEIYKEDPMILVTDWNNRKYQKGIRQQELLQENYLMCNFALQNVGQFIRNLFPKYHQFSLEIDDCSKIIPFLIGQQNYTFLPKDTAASYIKEKKLREVELLDFQTPVINSYIIGKKSKRNLLESMFIVANAYNL